MQTKLILGTGVLARELTVYIKETYGEDSLTVGPDGNILYDDYLRELNPIIIGSGNIEIRKRMLTEIRSATYIIKHKTSYVASDAIIEEGSVIAPMSCVAPRSRLHRHVLINYQATIGHDVVIEYGSVVAPAATILGNCKIGSFTYIGANSTIKEDVKVGSNCMVGMGAVVLNNIPDNTICIGNPAKTFTLEEWKIKKKDVKRI